MVVGESYKDSLLKIYSNTQIYFIVNKETGFKCAMTIDESDNLSLYEETSDEIGGLAQEIFGDGLIRSYSRNGYYILQNETGIKYTEAIDIPNRYTYSETDEKIPIEPTLPTSVEQLENQ